MRQRQAAVINIGGTTDLGADKLADWLTDSGYQVTCLLGDPGLFAYGFDLVCLSVVFSWHAPVARDIALRVQAHSAVWCGGPGMFALAAWWRRETGLPLQRGLPGFPPFFAVLAGGLPPGEELRGGQGFGGLAQAADINATRRRA